MWIFAAKMSFAPTARAEQMSTIRKLFRKTYSLSAPPQPVRSQVVPYKPFRFAVVVRHHSRRADDGRHGSVFFFELSKFERSHGRSDSRFIWFTLLTSRCSALPLPWCALNLSRFPQAGGVGDWYVSLQGAELARERAALSRSSVSFPVGFLPSSLVCSHYIFTLALSACHARTLFPLVLLQVGRASSFSKNWTHAISIRLWS
jgi:hypothetical protein